jgi:sialate O-acetylesterase
MINSFDQTDRWGVAADPLHRLPDAADRVHWRNKDAQGNPRKLEGDELKQWIANRKKGAGVGLPFALEMVRRTNVPIGLLPCAHGGTSMDQWSPELKDKGGDSLYGAMLRRVRASGGKVKGVLWYQGESDANDKAAPEFLAKFKKLIEEMRADFGQPELPVYYVQIGRHASSADAKPWNFVQNAQLQAESAIPNVGMVTCADCTLDDGIHVSTADHRLLGQRLANLACRDHFPDRAFCGLLKRGPRPVSAKARDGVIYVEFKETNGRLTAPGRLHGFSVHDADGKLARVIYHQRISPQQPNVVELHFGGKLPEGAVLHYGAGRDPYVNLRDEENMAAPVFGPLPIGN